MNDLSAVTELPVAIGDVRRAEAAIAGIVGKTPMVRAAALSEIAGCEVFLKLETLHATGSFKERGALNKLLSLNDNERGAGVVAMSAGNHAQGVAYHARRLGIPATIVMPLGTPFTKIDRTEALGARVVLKGDSLTDARLAADALVRERGLVPVHPYDDPSVIAGQGTIALEMLAQQPEIDTLVVPIGGGGLIGGMATAARAIAPGIRVIGVQTERFPAVWNAVHGEQRPCEQATIADGIGVKSPGALTLPLIRERVDDVLLVGEDDIEQAILMLLEIEKTVVEGAGAVGLAARRRARAFPALPPPRRSRARGCRPTPSPPGRRAGAARARSRRRGS